MTYGAAHNVDALLADLADCVAEVRAAPALDAEFIAAAAAALAADPSPEAIAGLMGAVGLQPGELPQEMALINELLDALPDAVANEILIDFFNAL
jgi:sphinganine-1-phosphate aldolase